IEAVTAPMSGTGPAPGWISGPGWNRRRRRPERSVCPDRPAPGAPRHPRERGTPMQFRSARLRARSARSRAGARLRCSLPAGWRYRRVVAGTAAALAVAGLAATSAPGAAVASSHREAPLIAGEPQLDNTDLYAFVSPDRPDT